jgi:hypothetical protein
LSKCAVVIHDLVFVPDFLSELEEQSVFQTGILSLENFKLSLFKITERA